MQILKDVYKEQDAIENGLATPRQIKTIVAMYYSAYGHAPAFNLENMTYAYACHVIATCGARYR